MYFPVFFHDFQSFWDDQWVVVNKYTENGLNIINLKSILLDYYEGQYAPVNQLYYSFLYQFFHYNPFVFHLGSLILHVANGILVYLLVNRILLLREIAGISEKYYVLLSFITALLFIIHPVSVESVAWISASKILLYTLFYLMGMIVYTYYLKRKSISTYLITLFLFIFSFGAKEQAVTFSLCMFLLDFIAGRNFKDYKLYVEKVPFLTLSIFFGFVTMWSQSAIGQGMLSESVQYPLYQRLVFACFAFTEYITKSFLPVKLSYIYPFPNQISESLPLRFWIYPIACFGVLWMVIHFVKKTWFIFLLAFFTLHIAVTLHIIPISRFTITADRYLYLSLIPVCATIGYIIIKYLLNFKTKNILFILIYIIFLGVYSNQRSTVWRSTDTLKEEIRGIIKNRDDFEALKKKMNL